MNFKKRMNRSWENFSREQINIIQEQTHPDNYGTDWTSSNESSDLSQLVGNKFDIIFEDGMVLSYEFCSSNQLVWSENDISHEAFYRAYSVPGHQEVLFIHHIRDGLLPITCVDLVIDLETKLVTIILARISNNIDYPRDVEHSIHFGWIDGIKDIIHTYTTELVGKAILWEMPPYTNKPPIKHIYLSPMYYGILMTRGDECYMAADPADYIKLKDNLYLVSIIEKHRSGIQLTFVINTELIEDVVGHFGISVGNELEKTDPKIVCTMITGRKGQFVPMETK